MSRFAVIGGGIAGLAAAYDLARRGDEVMVLEASDRVGGGEARDAAPHDRDLGADVRHAAPGARPSGRARPGPG